MININKLLVSLTLFLVAIICGIVIPPNLFGGNVQLIQIFFSVILVSLVAYQAIIFLYKDYIKVKNKLEKSLKIREEMLNLSNSIINTPVTDDLLNIILEKAINLIGEAEKGTFMIVDKNNMKEFKAIIGYNKETLKKIKLKVEDCYLYRKTNGVMDKPCIIENAKGFSIETRLSSPVFIDGKLYGLLNIESSVGKAFNDEDVKMMEFFSNQAGIVIKTHQLIDKILYISRYDDLTNTYNRRHFEELFVSLCEKAKNANKDFSLIFFDIDNLKFINDRYGHIVGDEIILNFSRVIQNNIRDSDVFARFGGDEFIAIFFNVEGNLVEKRIRKIKLSLNNNQISTNGVKVGVDFSYGISNYPLDACELNDLIEIADKRMYIHKERLKSVNL